MKERMTTQDLLDKFDAFVVHKNGKTVIIHPGLPYNHIELNIGFVKQLKKEIEASFRLAASDIEPLSAMAKFIIYMLEDSY